MDNRILTPFVEFQIVIVATDKGTGIHRLSPIDERLPHPLLPIANRPLISYQLELIQKAGFPSKVPVIIIVSENSHDKIRQCVSEIDDKINVDFVIMKDQIGTCEMLFRIRDKIISNYIIFMNNNLIVDNSFITQITDLHRFNDSSFTALLKPKDPNLKAKLDPNTEHLFTDYIALDEKKQRIVMMEAATELEDDVIIDKSLLKHFPNISINNNLQDQQLYIFSRWILDLLVEDHKNKKPLFFDVKKHLIPYLIKCQIPGGATSKQGISFPLPSSAVNLTQELAISLSSTASPSYVDLQLNSDSNNSPVNNNINTISNDKKLIKCFAYIIPPTAYSISINTVPSYHQANRDVIKGDTIYHPYEEKDPTKNSYIGESVKVVPTAVGQECVIGTGTVFGERCNIKNSVVGKHCKIGASVSIANSIIMDHVTIDDQCKINSSIIGNDVDIKKGCEIKECRIASNSTIIDKQLVKKSIG